MKNGFDQVGILNLMRVSKDWRSIRPDKILEKEERVAKFLLKESTCYNHPIILLSIHNNIVL